MTADDLILPPAPRDLSEILRDFDRRTEENRRFIERLIRGEVK